jgi:hypothetical protein
MEEHFSLRGIREHSAALGEDGLPPSKRRKLNNISVWSTLTSGKIRDLRKPW